MQMYGVGFLECVGGLLDMYLWCLNHILMAYQGCVYVVMLFVGLEGALK